jgi:uncharacterized membrane protein
MAVSRRLDDTFKISITLKGLDGLLEIIGGIALLVVTPNTIDRIVKALTQHELSEDPHDFIARHLLRSAGGLTHSTTLFAAIYLLSHGIAKVVLVVALFRDQLWAYPATIALLGAFIVYQLYRLALGFSIGIFLLTLFDAFVAWLTWREYRAKHLRRAARPAA